MEEERLGCYPFGELESCWVHNQGSLQDFAFGEGGNTIINIYLGPRFTTTYLVLLDPVARTAFGHWGVGIYEMKSGFPLKGNKRYLQ